MRYLRSLATGAVITLALSCTLGAQAPAARRGVTAEDYFSFHFAADPRLSPDGKQLLYADSRVDRARNLV